jgi:GntR family transcriptional regulator, sialic acid-inducible nan operon repressor
MIPRSSRRQGGSQVPEIIQRRRIYQEVRDRLMERIRSGDIPPNAQLPSERELMEEYGVGRPAVREALQALQRSGIVEIVHGERARVVVPTADQLVSQIASGAMHLVRSQPGSLEHLKEVRLFLETGTARMAAERATDEDIAKLRLAAARHRASMIDLGKFIELDMAFHREIAGVSRNPIFPAIVEAMFRWASTRYQSLVRAPGAEELTLAEHERIVDAIAARDPAAAGAAMHAHLSRANSLYRSLVKEPGDPAADFERH